MYNDVKAIHQQVQLFSDRFIGAAQLSQNAQADDTTHCLEELNRCVDEYGFQGVYLSPEPEGQLNSPGMHDPYWYPVYEASMEKGLPIIVHGTNCNDRRFEPVPHSSTGPTRPCPTPMPASASRS